MTSKTAPVQDWPSQHERNYTKISKTNQKLKMTHWD